MRGKGWASGLRKRRSLGSPRNGIAGQPQFDKRPIIFEVQKLTPISATLSVERFKIY
jgi:hypothetical protein